MCVAGHEGSQAAWQQAWWQGPTVCAWHAGQHDDVSRYTHNYAEQAPLKCKIEGIGLFCRPTAFQACFLLVCLSAQESSC